MLICQKIVLGVSIILGLERYVGDAPVDTELGWEVTGVLSADFDVRALLADRRRVVLEGTEHGKPVKVEFDAFMWIDDDGLHGDIVRSTIRKNGRLVG